MIGIEEGCIAVVKNCKPKRYIGKCCLVLGKAKDGQTVFNLGTGKTERVGSSHWFVDLNCGKSIRVVGCMNEKDLLRIDDYSINDMKRDHIFSMREAISNGVVPPQHFSCRCTRIPPMKKK